MSDLVCDRAFTIRIGEDERRAVAEWMRPVRWRGDWLCEWVVHWPDRESQVGRSYGVDSTQALLLGMSFVASLLTDRDAVWLDGLSGLGLPTND